MSVPTFLEHPEILNFEDIHNLFTPKLAGHRSQARGSRGSSMTRRQTFSESTSFIARGCSEETKPLNPIAFHFVTFEQGLRQVGSGT